MGNENMDEKLKNIQLEIDEAIDNLFVDKSAAEQKINTPPFQQSEFAAEEKSVLTDENEREPLFLNEKITDNTDTFKPEYNIEPPPETAQALSHDNLEQTINNIIAKITALSEWGITEKAVEKISGDVKKLTEKINENKPAVAITGMIMEVLKFFKENPDIPNADLLKFLTGGFSSLKLLLDPKKNAPNEIEKVFSSVNKRFSEISSQLSLRKFPENTDEFGKNTAGFQAEKIKTEAEAGFEELNTPEGADVLSDLTSFKKKESDDNLLINRAFLPPDSSSELKTPPLHEEEEVIEAMPENPRAEHTKDGMDVDTYYKNILEKVLQTAKLMEKESFMVQQVLEITEKLSVEIESLTALSNKLSIPTEEVSAQNTLNQLKNVNSSIQNDFKIFLKIVGKKDNDDFKAQEITPVVVGKRMIGIFSESISHLYSISLQQEKKFRKSGYIGLNGAQIPFVDLIEEFGETSVNSNKRLIVINTPSGKKALLVDKVLKKRFAFSNSPDSITGEDSILTARFFLTEEIIVYKPD